MNLTASQKTIIQLGSVLGLLAAAGVLAVVTNTLTGNQVYGIIGFLAGGTAFAGGIAIASPTTNTLPHYILVLAVLGLTVAMAVKNVFNATEVIGVFTFILGAGVLGAGSVVTTTKAAAINAAMHPNPQQAPLHVEVHDLHDPADPPRHLADPPLPAQPVA